MLTNLNFIPFNQTNALCGENLIKTAVMNNLHREMTKLVNYLEPIFNKMSKTDNEVKVIKNDDSGFTIEYMNWIFDFEFDGKFTWKPRFWYDSKITN
jgi:hypothetical protein